jgi:hypothetical protein
MMGLVVVARVGESNESQSQQCVLNDDETNSWR